MAVTPLSQLLNTLIFACFAIATYGFPTVALEGAFILFLLALFRRRLRNLALLDFVHVLPVVAFVFVINCLRGNGEILARFWIFFVVKQGVLRGLYFSLVILELFLMSRILTKGFEERELVAAIGKLTGSKTGVPAGARGDAPAPAADFPLVLLHVMRMFHIAYAELKPFFSLRSGRRRGGGLRGRVVSYFHSVYRKSLDEFERAPSEKSGAGNPDDPVRGGVNGGVRLLPLDWLTLGVQAALMGAAYFVRGR